MISDDLIVKMLKAEEGIRRFPYDCRTGAAVVAPVGKVTIGVGRNLQEKPLTDEAIDFLLKEDVAEVLEDARAIFSDVDEWAEGRQLAVISMIFQLGASGFLKFSHSIQSIRAKDWDKAAKEILQSKWADRDSPARAIRVSEMLRTGRHYYL